MAGRRILVTGGAGFVGSHLADRLIADGYAVTVLDDLSSGHAHNVPKAAHFVTGDIRDNDVVTRLIAENDACFHLAAVASVPKCHDDWRHSHSVNQSAFVALLEVVAKRKDGPIPTVYASSAAVYGDTGTAAASEALPPAPLSLYGADKAGCERVAAVAGRIAQVPTFGLRPFNIYGPRQDPSSPYAGVITQFAERFRAGQPITVFGDGQQTRDFIHVSDIVAILCAALPKASAQAPVCNAATGRATSILNLVQTLAAILGTAADMRFAPPRPGDIQHSYADISRMRNLLNVTAHVELADGLGHLLN